MEVIRLCNILFRPVLVTRDLSHQQHGDDAFVYSMKNSFEKSVGVNGTVCEVERKISGEMRKRSKKSEGRDERSGAFGSSEGRELFYAKRHFRR